MLDTKKVSTSHHLLDHAWLGLLLWVCLQIPVTRGSTEGSFRELLQGVRVSSRIVDGYNAGEDRYPYMVSLRKVLTEEHICGGVLVEEDLVLTAAHCVDVRGVMSEVHPILAIGVINRTLEDEANPEIRVACKTIIHKNYHSIEGGFDIALLILNKKSQKTPVYRLDSGSIQKRDGLLMTALGWGRKHPKGAFSDNLQGVDILSYRSNHLCSRDYGREDLIKDSMICAIANGADTCQGMNGPVNPLSNMPSAIKEVSEMWDSGGPLLHTWQANGVHKDTLMGLTSFGPEPCATESNIPGVYTRISEFVSWITLRGTDEDRIYLNGNERECLHVQDEAPVVLRSEEILQIVKGGDGDSMSAAVLRAAQSGEGGVQELSKAADSAIADCNFHDLTDAMTRAAHECEPEVRDMFYPILSRVKGAAQVECEAPSLPNAESVVEKIGAGDIDGAAVDVRTLAEVGENGTRVLNEIIARGILEGLVVKLARVVVKAMEGDASRAAQDILFPYEVELLIGLSVQGLSEKMLANDVQAGVDMIVELMRDTAYDISTCRHIILDATKQTVRKAKLKPENSDKVILSISAILFRADEALQESESGILESAAAFLADDVLGMP